MPVLPNQRHELFAQELAKGKTADEAYELAGYKPDRGHASRMASNGNICARVEELLGRAADGVVLTKQWVIERLIENVDRAMQAEEVKDSKGIATGEYRYDGSVANRALELLGKEKGMFIDRKEVGKPGDFDRMTEDELEEFIARRQGASGEGLGGTGKANGQAGVRGKPSGLH